MHCHKGDSIGGKSCPKQMHFLCFGSNNAYMLGVMMDSWVMVMKDSWVVVMKDSVLFKRELEYFVVSLITRLLFHSMLFKT